MAYQTAVKRWVYRNEAEKGVAQAGAQAFSDKMHEETGRRYPVEPRTYEPDSYRVVQGQVYAGTYFEVYFDEMFDPEY